VSAGIEVAAPEAGRRPGAFDGEDRPIVRVAIVGATGFVGAELVRILARHPNVEIVGLVGRERDDVPIETIHPHLAGTGLAVDAQLPAVDAIFAALPHGVAAAQAAAWLETGAAVIDLGPDFRLRDPADYPRWYRFEHPAPDLLGAAVYGLPELRRAELEALAGPGPGSRRIVGSPGCYPTATLLALAPLARAGLIGDLVVDAKSGVSGAGRDPKPEMMFGEVNESVRAYGIDGHRHVAEIEQELAALGAAGGTDNPGAHGVDFLPHLIPMSRGILAACHVRPSRPIDQSELDRLYAEAYAEEPFVRVVSDAPATRHVTGSNEARIFVRHDARTGRVLAIGVIDNLVKGAAGQAVQAFNLVHGLPETAGLTQLPLVP
jgi:N-acetyl-gamma-glutamyl-phosphate reductase